MKLINIWLQYVIVLGVWILLSYLIDPQNELFMMMFYLALIALIVSLLRIANKIICDKNISGSITFIKLSRLPIIIIASHALVLLTGRTFNSEGGWWILYALLYLGIPLSLVLFIGGKLIQKKEMKQ